MPAAHNASRPSATWAQIRTAVGTIERPLAFQPVFERAAFDEQCRQIRKTIVLARIEYRDDVRIADGLGDARPLV